MNLQSLVSTTLNESSPSDPVKVREVFAKAKEMRGLSKADVNVLLSDLDDTLEKELFEAAHYIKEEIYGKRIVLFAPLYLSNKCHNNCLYCAFRHSNTELIRTQLSQDEIIGEVKCLIEEGHKRLLLVAGEEGTKKELDYVLDSIATVYSISTPKGNIRRVNVNIAPLSVENFKRLKEANIGTYQCFQETYNETIYKTLHPSGPKSNYLNRLHVMDRAYTAGLSDVGIGVLFGLAPWKEEVFALMGHVEYLEKEFGVGPHTISVPRIEPAYGADYTQNPLNPVSDKDFYKIIAILRLAVPYTGIILSTRESAATRKKCLDLGISQMSAGSKTDPGGYQLESTHQNKEQFTTGDHRNLQEVIKEIVTMGHIPSFCTGCYRMGRVGADFMDLAKPGLIKKHCLTNAISSFYEYLVDFSDPELKTSGTDLIHTMINRDVPNENLKKYIHDSLEKINKGSRDLYL